MFKRLKYNHNKNQFFLYFILLFHFILFKNKSEYYKLKTFFIFTSSSDLIRLVSLLVTSSVCQFVLSFFHSLGFLVDNMLSPNSCTKYFKLGSKTRRDGVIGCMGYENANPPIPSLVETVDVGVGCDCANEIVTCAICLENINAGYGTVQKNIATTECGHTFCLSCLLTNLHTSNLCPLCRAPVEQNVKRVLKPLSYEEGIGLLDRELDGLRIYEDVEQFVQNAMEISSQPNTTGQNVDDVIGNIMIMVTNFGFNLLFDATLHTNGGEEQMDPEWINQMYDDDDDDGDNDNDSTINDYNSESDDSESESDSDGGDGGDGGDGDDESKNKRIVLFVLPEVPESMLE